jgi:flagellar hook-length control protein FliK
MDMPDTIPVSGSTATLKNFNLGKELADTAQTDGFEASIFAALLPQQFAQLAAATTGGDAPNSLAAGKALPEDAERSATQDTNAPTVELLESGAFIWPYTHPVAAPAIADGAAPEAAALQSAAIPNGSPNASGGADGPVTAPLPTTVSDALDQLRNDDASPTVAAGDTPIRTGIVAEAAPTSESVLSANAIVPAGAAKTDAPAPGTTVLAKDQPVAAMVNLSTRDPRWGEAFASRVVWQVGEQIQQAHIQVNPPELGPVDVKVQVQDGQASVQFQIQHAALKETIQDAIPRLRDMLAQAGINLADANISQGFAGQGRNSANTPNLARSPWEEKGAMDSIEAQPMAARIESREGLIDAYA